MGRDLYEHSAAAREVYAAANEAFGGALADICFQGPDDALRATHVQQPAIVATSLAALAAFKEALGAAEPTSIGGLGSLNVVAMAGHSLGVCSAVSAAGALSLKETIALVADRGRFMASAGRATPGAMAAVIGLTADAVEQVVEEVRDRVAGSYLSVANVNTPLQVVVAGDLSSVAAFHEAARAAGARRVVPLDVSAAFHTVAMLPAREAMRNRLLAAPLFDPSVPIVSNLDAGLLSSAAQLRGELADHMVAPVQWLRGARALVPLGISGIIEFGHGNVLAGMLRRTVRDVELHNVSDAASVKRTVEGVIGA